MDLLWTVGAWRVAVRGKTLGGLAGSESVDRERARTLKNSKSKSAQIL